MNQHRLQSVLSAVLFINHSDSQCGYCGHSADPRESEHYTRLGRGDDRRGCGIRWTAVSSEYGLTPDFVEAIRSLQPTLPLVRIEYAR